MSIYDSKFYVYQFRLETSITPFYIGKGHGDRIKAHFQPSQRKIKNIKNNMITHAETNNIKVVVEKLHENLTEDVAISLEIWYIYKFGRIDNHTGILANHTDGGDGLSGRVVSDEARKKMSISRSGVNHPMYGKKHSQETKNKISKSNGGENNPNFGKERSAETKLRSSISNTGLKRTEETRKRISDSKSGANHPMYGKTRKRSE